jgi:lipid A 3-O-deacylase
MRWLRLSFRLIKTIAISTVVASPVASQETRWSNTPYEIALSAGVFDIDARHQPAEAGLEVRKRSIWRGLGVMAGISGTEDASVWIYGGARYDLVGGTRWTVAPGFAVSLYEQGDGKDLGQALEFRSSIELGRRVSERLQVGLVFYHLSNASMQEVNPGSNSLVLSFAFQTRGRETTSF